MRTEYIQQLRERLGPLPVLIPATAVVLLNPEGEVLLHLRGASGLWGLPGGLMDLGETACEGAARELREESSLVAEGLALYGIFSGPRFEVQYPNGDRTAPVVLAFHSSGYRGVPLPQEESPEIGFFPFSALPEALHHQHREFIEGFLEFRASGRLILR